MKSTKLLIPLNLQFFAEGEDGAGEGDNAGAGAADAGQQGNGDQNHEGGNSNKSGDDESGKKFTQAELSAVAATEKKQGKQSILNLFGVKSEKEAKEQAAAFKQWQESQKDTEQKLKDSQEATSEAEKRAAAAEAKLACVTAGVQKDSIDDVLAIAAAKVTDDKNLDAVLEEMKKDTKYKGFFNTGTGSAGTGSSADHKGGAGTGGAGENYGARLAKSKSAKVKSAFFSD